MRSKLSTGYGDSGWTQAGIHKRCHKDDAVLEVLGDLDELNCWLGKIREQHLQFDADIAKIQSCIFEFGVSVIESREVKPPIAEDVLWIEEKTVELEKDIPPLKNFILPYFPSDVHLARAVCRRAERKLYSFYRQFGEVSLPFINRLSDYLFVLARHICYASNKEEKIWRRA